MNSRKQFAATLPLSKDKPASVIRYEQARAEIVRKMALIGGAVTQSEMIASHYTKLATTALDLLHLCKMRQRGGASADIDAAIDYLTQTIKQAHLEDLAIPLEWRDDEAPK